LNALLTFCDLFLATGSSRRSGKFVVEYDEDSEDDEDAENQYFSLEDEHVSYETFTIVNLVHASLEEHHSFDSQLLFSRLE